MRISYADEEDFPGQTDLWQANLERSLRGRKGQAALREIEQALLALPEQKLIADALQDDAGQVCAIGALAKHKGVPIPPSLDFGCDEDYKVTDQMIEVGRSLGVPKLVAIAVIHENDEGIWITSKDRYERVLAWVRRRLLTLVLLLTLAGAANADPVIHGNGSATITYSAVFGFATPPLFTFNVTNTSLTPLSTIGFSLPSGLGGSQFALASGAGVFSAQSPLPFTFAVGLGLAPGATTIFSISGAWFVNGTGLTNVQDLMHVYFLSPRPVRPMTITPRNALASETPELSSILLLGTGLFGVAIRWRRKTKHHPA